MGIFLIFQKKIENPSMAFKLRGPSHSSFYVLIILLLLHVPLLSPTSAQVRPPVLYAHSEILQVLVPNRTSFQEFVDCSNGPTAVSGFCIDVFKYALSILIPKTNWTEVNYTCYDLDSTDRTYNMMINELQDSSFYDAVVGDITISALRMEKVNFTQSYLDSGIVLLIPAVGAFRHFLGVFAAPFTRNAWIIVIGSIILTFCFLRVVEKFGTQDFDRPFIIRFVTSALIFLKPEESWTDPVPKLIMIAWTVYILVVSSAYTASLSAILTVKELSSDIKTFADLKNANLSIGYLSLSLVEDYLKQIQKITNFAGLKSEDDYENALQTRQVAAIAEESPYVSLFLANQPASKCKFLVSPKLTTEGFGFAFRNESLSSAFSVAILNLSESGHLQRLQDGWKLSNFRCSSQIQSTQLNVDSVLYCFVGLLLAVVLLCMGHKYREKILLWLRPIHDKIAAVWERIVPGFMRRWFSRSSARRHQTTL